MIVGIRVDSMSMGTTVKAQEEVGLGRRLKAVVKTREKGRIGVDSSWVKRIVVIIKTYSNSKVRRKKYRDIYRIVKLIVVIKMDAPVANCWD